MAPRVFSEEQEAQFIRIWHEVLANSQGQMLTKLDKLLRSSALLSEWCRVRGLPDVDEKQCKHKLDGLKKKAKAVYSKMKVLTTSGMPVADPGDLEVRLVLFLFLLLKCYNVSQSHCVDCRHWDCSWTYNANLHILKKIDDFHLQFQESRIASNGRDLYFLLLKYYNVFIFASQVHVV